MKSGIEKDIIDEIVDGMNESDVLFLKSCENQEYLMSVIPFLRYVRNKYGLWDSLNPLTFAHKDFKEKIIDGVDYNPRHPDKVSHDIVKKAFEELGILTKESIYERSMIDEH